ncbi:PEP-CTERM sorting domain-containing protein [Massilia sp. erpn]|nr:PEP-CTERM sorting domain-containing protein [Massilia sp. erpn]
MATAAHAATSLLSAAEQKQLATWLGEGEIKLNTIYAKSAGDTAANFHAAVDGKGRTFSVMEATNKAGQTWLVGGYNPVSWSSSGQYNRNMGSSGRTAFLFNLSSSSLHRQMPRAGGMEEVGSYQTYNGKNYGPTFGWGHDLFVPYDLTKGGHSFLYSYADPNGGNFNISLLDGSPSESRSITFGRIEVYSIGVVPEPASYLMLLGGVGLLAWRRRSAGK